MISSFNGDAYQICSLTLDANCELLLASDGTELPLRPKTFALLRLLVQNAGRTISKEEIMASVWPDLFVTENNINQCVHEIRRAFGVGAKHILRTRSRRGYLLDASVVAVLSRPGSPRAGMEPDAIPKGQVQQQIGNRWEGIGANLAGGLDPAKGAA
jgi:DNA-binding winged helix-turn-helix (wHTH) protein